MIWRFTYRFPAGRRAATAATVAGSREKRPAVRANGSASIAAHAASMLATGSSVTSGPKISSSSIGESTGRSAATSGSQNHPTVGACGPRATILPCVSASAA